MTLYMQFLTILIGLNYHQDDARRIAKRYSRRKNGASAFKADYLPNWYKG